MSTPLSGSSIECAFPVIKESIPASRLGYDSNNVYPGFPPLMADSRAVIASWQPDAVANEQLIQDNGIKSNWEYRKFLQGNAKQVMETNFRAASNDTGYYNRWIDHKLHSGEPILYTSVSDSRKPEFYEDSDLKQTYLSREQLDAMKMAPTLS
jgi:hypothetical protein